MGSPVSMLCGRAHCLCLVRFLGLVSMADPWWSCETVAVVSGSCTGIGLEIVKQLAGLGITTVLTGRSPHKISKAINLLNEQGLHVLSHVLDVTDSTSIQEFAAWVKNELGGLDILINNAGVGALRDSKLVIQTNYYGAKQLTEAMLPIFRTAAAGSRIVMICSSASRLDWLKGEASAEWLPKLTNVEALSEELVHSFIQSFLQDEEQGKCIEKGWPTLDSINEPTQIANYCVSKMAMSAYTRMLARDLANRSSGHKIYANCVCPGLTSTPLTANCGHSAEIGAEVAVWLALLPQKDCPTGDFFVDKKNVGFEHVPLFYKGRCCDLDLEEHRRHLVQN